MAGAGVAMAASLGYLLGLRHGRTEIVLSAVPGADLASAANAAPGATALAFVERFHALSSHSRAGLLARAPSPDWGAAVPPFKAVEGLRPVALGAPRPTLPAEPAGRLALDTLGTLLWHTAGGREQRGGIAFRTAPSSGALFASELTVAVRTVDGLAPGTWHYQPQRHALALLKAGAPPRSCGPRPCSVAAAASTATAPTATSRSTWAMRWRTCARPASAPAWRCPHGQLAGRRGLR